MFQKYKIQKRQSAQARIFRISDFGFRAYQCEPKGFTLIEMLIVIGIVSLLAGTSMTSLTKSRTQNALRQGAQELSLAYRNAESNALSIRESGGKFPGYGIYISAVNQPTYFMFADVYPDGDGDGTGDDGQYTSSQDTTIGGQKVLPRGAVIKKLYSGGPLASNLVEIPNLSVVFLRPTPTVLFANGGALITTPGVGFVAICVGTADSTLVKMIRIWRTGHVAVSQYGNDCLSL